MTVGAGDLLFPIPEPTWLWIHSFVLSRRTAASVIDAEGRWGETQSASVTVTGYVTQPNPEDLERANAQRIKMNAIALVPKTTVVAEQDEVIVSGISDALNGTYTISQVREPLTHKKLVLARILGPDPYPAD